MKIIGSTSAREHERDIARRLGRIEQRSGIIGRDKVVPSDQRPDPVGRPGLRIFDLTLGKPLWSNGSVWVDATGTAV